MTNLGIVGSARSSLSTYTNAGIAVPNPAKWDAVNGIYNLTAYNMATWRAALDKAGAGTRQATLSFLGDSTTYGFQGSTPYSTGSPPGQIRTALDALYGAVGPGSIDPTESSDSGNSGDSRATSTYASANAGYGAYGMLGVQNGQSSACTFPSGIDTVTVWFGSIGGNSSSAVTVQVDGSTVETVNTSAGGNTVISKSYTVSTGSGHTLTVVGPATLNAWVLGFSGRKNVTSGILVNRVGRSGSGIGAVAPNSQGNLAPATFIANNLGGDCFVLQHGINDRSSSPLAWAETVRSTVAAWQAVGSVILMTPYPISASIDSTLKPSYLKLVEALYWVADTANVPLIDFSHRWNLNYWVGTSTISTAVHPGASGYADAASVCYWALTGRTLATGSSTTTGQSVDQTSLWLAGVR